MTPMAQMAQPLSSLEGLVRAVHLGPDPAHAPASVGWCLRALAGRLTEISGLGDSAALTLAFSVVLDAQRQGETTAWITRRESSFLPLDAWASGVDLEALAVVRVPDERAVVRAADRLARSGGFGLLVLDLAAGDDKATALGRHPIQIPTAMQARLRGLAHRHGIAVLFLTRKGASTTSLGSLVSLHARARRERTPEGLYRCRLEVIKDKHRGPGWEVFETCRGPDGLY